MIGCKNNQSNKEERRKEDNNLEDRKIYDINPRKKDKQTGQRSKT